MGQDTSQGRRHTIQHLPRRLAYLHHHRLKDAAICRRSCSRASFEGSPAHFLPPLEKRQEGAFCVEVARRRGQDHDVVDETFRTLPSAEESGLEHGLHHRKLQHSCRDDIVLMGRTYRHGVKSNGLNTLQQILPAVVADVGGDRHGLCEGLCGGRRLPFLPVRPCHTGQTSGGLDIQAVPLLSCDAGRRIHAVHQGPEHCLQHTTARRQVLGAQRHGQGQVRRRGDSALGFGAFQQPHLGISDETFRA